MEILGLVFAGTATNRRVAMAAFVEDTLGLRRAAAFEGEADMFELPDGSRFAVANERDAWPGTSRTMGFLVADLDAARTDLLAAGLEMDDPAANDTHRYAHFIAPDGEVYELVELLRPDAPSTSS